MAGTDGAGSVQAVRMRIARLAADGSTPAGASNMYVTDTIVQVQLNPVYAAGDDLEQKNGSGAVCVTWKANDTLKRVDVSLTVCVPDEELEEILGGGSVLTASGSTVGYAMPAVGADPMPNGISLEFWTRAIINGAPAATKPYRWWAVPRIYLRRDNATYDSGITAPVFSGYAIENPGWANGPNNDWTLASARAVQRQRVDATALPASAVGYQATPVQT